MPDSWTQMSMNYEDLMKLRGSWVMKWWNPQPAAGQGKPVICRVVASCVPRRRHLSSLLATCGCVTTGAVWPVCPSAHHRGMVPVPATRTHHTCRTLLFMLGYLGKGIRFDIQCTWMAWCFHQCSGCRMFKYVFIHLNNIYIKYFYVFQYYTWNEYFFPFMLAASTSVKVDNAMRVVNIVVTSSCSVSFQSSYSKVLNLSTYLTF